MFADALFKDFGTYSKYDDGKIVVHVVCWTTFVDRCYKSNFKVRRYDPCCNGKVDGVCQGLCDYDSNIFEKNWQKSVRSSGLFTLTFFSLTNTLETVTGISLKASLVFILALYGCGQMKFLNLIDFSFKAPAIFEKKEQNPLAMNFLLVVHLGSMLNDRAGGSLVLVGKNSFHHFPEFSWIFFRISQDRLAFFVHAV